MKVIVAGSRSIVDRKLIWEAIDTSNLLITEIVSGGARGVDRIGEEWAKEHSIPITRFIPDWDGLGRRAGFVRNEDMAHYADALVAVWDGASHGTKHMIDYMRKQNKPVYVYEH